MSYKSQLVKGLKKIFREYGALATDTDREFFLQKVAEAMVRAKFEDGKLRNFLRLMKADED